MAKKAKDLNTVDLTLGNYRRQYSNYIFSKKFDDELPIDAEGWYWRLQRTADDFGNMQGDPSVVWANTIGRRTLSWQQVGVLVQGIAEKGLIQFYYHRGERYIHIVGFEERQPGARNGKRAMKFTPPEDADGEMGAYRLIQVDPGASNENEVDSNMDDLGASRCIQVHPDSTRGVQVHPGAKGFSEQQHKQNQNQDLDQEQEQECSGKSSVDLKNHNRGINVDLQKKRKSTRIPKTEKIEIEAREAFDHWKTKMGRTNETIFTPKRRRYIKARLNEGRTVAEINLATDGCERSDWHMARGAHQGITQHNDIWWICEGSERIDQFIGFAQAEYVNGSTKQNGRGFLTIEQIQQAQERMFENENGKSNEAPSNGADHSERDIDADTQDSNPAPGPDEDEILPALPE